jgi:uncharacterized protein
MKKPNLHQFAAVMLLTLMVQNCQRGTHMEKILVITGGHDFEPSFYQVFDSFEHVQYDTISQPDFNKKLCSGVADPYDALVFYDMWQDISEAEKTAFRALLERGKGMVFLHHSLVSYQHWDEFEKIIGGKYIEKDFYSDPAMQGSTYAEDITLAIKVVDNHHPVTKNVADFTIYDEGYQDIRINPDIHPLLSASHPDCASTVAWTNRYGNSKIVYLLLGHGHQAHENENYRKLVCNAIRWVGGTE